MPRSKHLTITPVSDADGIAQSQTPAAGGEQSLTLNGVLTSGGVATFATPHIVEITSAGNDSGRTFTVVGKGEGGQPLTVTLTGVNAGTTSTTRYFIEVSSITVDANTAGAVTVGTSGLCASPWYPTNYSGCGNPKIAFSVELSGTMTYSVQHTLDDVQDSDKTLTAFNHSSVAAATSSDDGNYEYLPTAIRMTVTAFTSGTAEFNIVPNG